MKSILQYEGLVYSICLSFAKNPFDAEDLAQETFLTAYSKFSQYSGGSQKAWITTIAANKCRDFLRRSRPACDIDALCICDDKNSPEESVVSKDSDAAVRRVISRLDEPYRTVAEKYFLEDIKLSEYSKLTGINEKTLRTRLYRAKQRLKTLWREEEKNAFR